MARQHALFLQRPEHKVGIDGVAREAEAPTRIAEAHALDPVANLELPPVGIVVGVEPLHAVVRTWMRQNVKLRMTREHLVVDAADPVAARPDFSVWHRAQETAERCAEGLEHVLRRVEGNAANQQQLLAHRCHLLPLCTCVDRKVVVCTGSDDVGWLIGCYRVLMTAPMSVTGAPAPSPPGGLRSAVPARLWRAWRCRP